MNFNETIDYSALSTYLSCPRKFAFQYVMHLKHSSPAIDLAFGACWHSGLEAAYRALKIESMLKEYDLFVASQFGFKLLWERNYASIWRDTDIIFPKSPGHATNMYEKYWKRFLTVDRDYRILDVEIPFVISLSSYGDYPNYVGRIDLALEASDGSILIVDHKTTRNVDKATSDSYYASLQTDGYLTAGSLYWDKIPLIEYRVALCQKAKIDFERFQFMKRSNMLDRFMNELVHFIGRIKVDLLCYETESQNLDKTFIPISFPRSAGYACTAYYRKCPYYDLCFSRCNPYLWKQSPPEGYVIEEWNPTDHYKEA